MKSEWDYQDVDHEAALRVKRNKEIYEDNSEEVFMYHQDSHRSEMDVDCDNNSINKCALGKYLNKTSSNKASLLINLKYLRSSKFLKYRFIYFFIFR